MHRTWQCRTAYWCPANGALPPSIPYFLPLSLCTLIKETKTKWKWLLLRLNADTDQIITNNITDPDYYFSKVHGGLRGHPGSKRTWTRLNNVCNGHNITFTYIADKVAFCPTCQKIRLNMELDIKPIIKSLNAGHVGQEATLSAM